MSNDRSNVPARGLRILIADDNARIRLLMRTVLADLKAEFHEASDGQSAVESARAHPPDWVLMDFKMKPVNGLVAAAKIRDEWPAARVVMVTNSDDAIVRAGAAEAGVFRYILKDDLFAVRKLIRSNLGSWGTADAGRS